MNYCAFFRKSLKHCIILTCHSRKSSRLFQKCNYPEQQCVSFELRVLLQPYNKKDTENKYLPRDLIYKDLTYLRYRIISHWTTRVRLKRPLTLCQRAVTNNKQLLHAANRSICSLSISNRCHIIIFEDVITLMNKCSFAHRE